MLRQGLLAGEEQRANPVQIAEILYTLGFAIRGQVGVVSPSSTNTFEILLLCVWENSSQLVHFSFSIDNSREVQDDAESLNVLISRSTLYWESNFALWRLPAVSSTIGNWCWSSNGQRYLPGHFTYTFCNTIPTGSQGKLEEADALLLRAIGVQEKALGPEHPELAASLSSRANVLQAQVTDRALSAASVRCCKNS